MDVSTLKEEQYYCHDSQSVHEHFGSVVEKLFWVNRDTLKFTSVDDKMPA